ncbi:MAG: hypothetical protein ACM3MM_06560 [Acidobacteriota bacterium]
MDDVLRARLAVVLAASAIALAAIAASVVMAQVETTPAAVDVTRTCGSVFDAVADRSGWEIWWAQDLDEPDPEVRSALVRTSGCPDAINGRLALAAVLGGVAALAVLGAAVLRADRRRSRTRADVADRLVRLGRITSLAGVILTLAGVVAVVLLVADADSTLFLYTDRLVVGVVGLIVLVPTASLVVIGRALTILGGTDDLRGVGIDPVPQDAVEDAIEGGADA